MNAHSPIGILLVNTGTPDAPTKEAVVRYLRRFLMDPRIVGIPSFIWKPILNGIVLRVRPVKTVGIYQRIWTPTGSPYTLHSQALERAVAQEFATRGNDGALVRMAHRYGNPSMEAELRNFKQRGIERVVMLPLYPQQAFATTASVHDELDRQLTALDYHPHLTFIEDYHTQPSWIQAVAESVRPHLTAKGTQPHLLFSFHSEPLKDVRNGDPYKQQVEESVAAIAACLGLVEDSFSWAYQSRFDDAQRWLGPFLPQKISALKAQGIKDLLIVCPGFAVDCTETLYDIAIKLACELSNEGHSLPFTYLPCLNGSPSHARALADAIEKRL
jgi:ferrochelatase